MRRIATLDVLGEVRRAKRILNRVQAYLEQEERRAGKRAKLEQATRYEMRRRADLEDKALDGRHAFEDAMDRGSA